MIAAITSLVALVCGVLLGVLGERWRIRRAERTRELPTPPARLGVPRVAGEMAGNVRTSVDHALEGDRRAPVLARYVGDCVVEAYCRGAGDMAEAVAYGGPLSPEVMDQIASDALRVVERR